MSTPTRTPGSDIEGVETRQESFVRQWLTDPEQRLVETLPGVSRWEAVSMIWTIKEAVSKALGLGLRLASREMVVDGISKDGTARVSLCGLAAQRFEDLGASRLSAACRPWDDSVLSWAKIELGQDRSGVSPAAPRLFGARDHRVPGSSPGGNGDSSRSFDA